MQIMLKDDYERECVDSCIRKIEANNTICVVPYEAINGFVFGDTEYAFQEEQVSWWRIISVRI